MKYYESKTTELKEKYTKSLLKTISAFANEDGGKIYIGIGDDGTIVGIENPAIEKIRIEGMINDSISPKPRYTMNSIVEQGRQIIEINVFKGLDGPYYYESKAYVRNDTSTIPLDGPNLTRLILKSKNMSFDQLPSQNSILSFDYMSQRLKERLGIEELSNGVKTTLGIMKNGEYNQGAILLSDEGSIISSFVDVAKFQLDIDEFEDRKKLSNASILKYFDDAIGLFSTYYQPKEIIKGAIREKIEKIPLEAFREALANAIIHRDYLILGGIQIAMFDNRIEIQSPGGLPDGLTKEMYFSGLTSITRNPVIAFVFYRLGLIEQFGTGIRRIVNSYQRYGLKPSFQINDDQVKIILPVIDFDYEKLNADNAILSYLKAYPNATRSEVEQAINKEKSFVIRRLNHFLEEGLVSVAGNGPNTTYLPK